MCWMESLYTLLRCRCCRRCKQQPRKEQGELPSARVYVQGGARAWWSRGVNSSIRMRDCRFINAIGEAFRLFMLIQFDYMYMFLESGGSVFPDTKKIGIHVIRNVTCAYDQASLIERKRLAKHGNNDIHSEIIILAVFLPSGSPYRWSDLQWP